MSFERGIALLAFQGSIVELRGVLVQLAAWSAEFEACGAILVHGQGAVGDRR